MEKYLINNAKRLRKNATLAEKILWSLLRARRLNGVKFRRQQPMGSYIVDFMSFEKKIVIELDGYSHRRLKKKDAARDQYLEGKGYKVLRFWNSEVTNKTELVIRKILNTMEAA